MSGLRRTPLYRALHRPNLILGGEREPMIIVLFVSVALMGLAMNFYAFLVGLLFLFGSVYGLRQMAKHDPCMSKVFFQQLFLKKYYAPFSHPARIGKNSWNSKGY
ncbi:MAG TPA: conjugal transfer protein TrbD [Anaerolineales bacterium]